MLRCPEFLVSDRYAILYKLSVMYFRPFSWLFVCILKNWRIDEAIVYLRMTFLNFIRQATNVNTKRQIS